MTRDELEKIQRESYELPNNVVKTAPRPVVSVRTLAYNHGAFIRQCIESILAQKTTFPIEYIIGEDFSTDGTREIIFDYAQKYPGIIRVITADRNVGMVGNGERISLACRGKYIAQCEGDDYWTDPSKLQKQVDFFEANPEYAMCCGAYETLNVDTGERHTVNLYNRIAAKRYQEPSPAGASFGLAEMEDYWLTKTLTMIFRSEARREYETKEYRYARDIHSHYHIVKAGKAFYFNQVFGVYRIHAGGVNSAHHGRANTNVTYRCYRELYEKNGDEFTRRMYLKSLLALLGYDLVHSYPENTLGRKVGLLRDALGLIRRKSEYVWLFRPVLPSRVRALLRK